MNLHIAYLLDSLHDTAELDDVQLGQYVKCCEAVHQLDSEDVVELLDAMCVHVALPQGARDPLLDPLLAHLVARQSQVETVITPAERERILTLYTALGGSSRCAWRLLQWLAKSAQTEDLQVLVHCVVTDPPEEPQAAALALTPLFQQRDYDPSGLFPPLFAALQHLSIAAPVLDLANYLTRQKMLAVHPGSERTADLAQLLGRLVEQLACIEENPGASGDAPEMVSQRVDECVALVVALCDAMALVGDTQVVGKLYRTLELRHRRIRTAAAASLASLGDAAGEQELVKLAEEPVARLRVLAQAEELGLLERIEERFRSDEARAEAEVALELAQPSFFGLPPSSLQLLDARTQFWPGYEHPVTCYLFRYEYCFQDTLYSNVAIAGPLVHAFTADLSDLPPDDIYAAYAGWHVDDESVFEVSLDAPTLQQRAEAERFERKLHDEGYDAIQSLMLGYFFGERALVARARREQATGLVAVDQHGIEWYRLTTRRHPLGPREVFCIYKGRRLLRSFNN